MLVTEIYNGQGLGNQLWISWQKLKTLFELI